MCLDKQIEQLSSRKYQIEGLGGTETVRVGDFILDVRELPSGYRREMQMHYTLYHQGGKGKIKTADGYYNERKMVLGDSPFEGLEFELEEKSSKLKETLKKSAGKYLSDELINDIVDLYVLQLERSIILSAGSLRIRPRFSGQ